MISLEVKQAILEHLETRYGESFETAHIDIHQSEATPGMRFSTTAWPATNPGIRFYVSYQQETGQITEDYIKAFVSHKSEKEIISALENSFAQKPDLMYSMLISLPSGYVIKKDDTLDTLLEEYPGKVSLNLSMLIGVQSDGFDRSSALAGIEDFLDGYVKKRGFNYITLTIRYIGREHLAAYLDADSEYYLSEPDTGRLAAEFYIAEKAAEINTARLASYLTLPGGGE